MGRKQAVEPPPWEGSRQWNHHHGKEAGSGIITMGRKQAVESSPWEGSRQWNHHHGKEAGSGTTTMSASIQLQNGGTQVLY